MHFGGVYHFQNWIQCDRVREGRARPHGCRLASVAQLERSTWQVLKSTALYEAYAGFHVIHLHTEGAPLLLFSAPSDVPKASPRDLCEAGNLGNLEANVMAGRALLGVLQLPDTQQRCIILLVHEKVMHSGTSKKPCSASNQTHCLEVARACNRLITNCSDVLRTTFGPVSQNNELL